MTEKSKKIPKRRQRWRIIKVVLLVSGIVGAYTEFLDPNYEYRVITGKDSYMFNSPSIVKGEFEGYRVRTTDKDKRPVTYLVATDPNSQPQVIFSENGWRYDFKVCLGDRKPKLQANSIDDITDNCFEIEARPYKRKNGHWLGYEPNFDKPDTIQEWRPWYSLKIWKTLFPTYFNDPKTIDRLKAAYYLAERARNHLHGI
jgi:hypothetical protein